jgi:hypothetical protein
LTGYIQRQLPPVSSIMRPEKLDTLGIHFLQADYYWRLEQIDAISRHILTISQSERASCIKRLEISLPTLRVFIRDPLQTKFISLEQLSIHTSPMPFISYDNPGPEVLDWSAYHHLTTMKLSRFRRENMIYSFRIPDMVREHPSLRELFISDLGIDSEREVETRPKGWSFLPTEWWNQRKPLRLLHIEGTLNMTIHFLGPIPVEKVQLVPRGTRVNFKFLMLDEEIFPHLQSLSVEKSTLITATELLGGEDWTDYLSEVCGRRDISLNVSTVGDRGFPAHNLWEGPRGTSRAL